MTTKTLQPIADIRPEDLISVYNGKHGCACGCRGTHSYMSAREGTLRRGYPVDASEVSLRRVANTLRTIQQHADAKGYDDGRVGGYGYIAYESETRLYIVYPKER